MSLKTYVTKEEGEGLAFGYDYKQVFHHESSQPKTMPEYTLVKQFTKQNEYDKLVSLEVLKFLYQFTFATHTQLVRMLELKGIDPAGLDDLIAKMLKEREMNCFYLNQFVQSGAMPEDAFIVYCMDFGAIAILSHFSNSDCITWFTTDCERSTELILKYLTTSMFYISLAEFRGDSLRYFKPIFDVTIGHRDIRFSAAFEVMQGFTAHPFILESIRSYDLPVNWTEKIDRKIVPFSCQEKYWSKYYPNREPVYIFLVEDDKQALEAADLFYRRTDKENFRLITDDQVKGGLATAHFLKYVPNANPEKCGTLHRVQGGLLCGSNSSSDAT